MSEIGKFLLGICNNNCQIDMTIPEIAEQVANAKFRDMDMRIYACQIGISFKRM